MKYTRFGISFSLMKEEDIEMVRQWRNDPVVVRNYAFRDHITPEMQKEWYKKVNNINNLYTIIEYQGEKVGVINLKNIDWENRTYESGIFIPYEKYHNTPLPAIVSYITTEIPFKLFDWQIGYAHVLKANKATQSFIKQLGYVLSPGQENVDNQEYSMTRETFEKKGVKIRKALSTLLPLTDTGKLFFDRDELNEDVIRQWEDIVKKSPAVIRVESTEAGITYYFS
jgi:UDP-4-amino-4,6-dideoxy-N-acetyl-beta-L-altrosamine N-acetyltransferase